MSCKDHNGNTCEINKGMCIGEEECEKAKLLQEIKELQKENAELKGKLDAYQMSENEGNEIIAELKAENELIKTQYNCYACGNCKGKEDYINLEKHHKGLRKQFDKKVQTLQEIKNVAEVCCSGIECEECPFTDDCKTDSQALGVCRIILKLITKAEEE